MTITKDLLVVGGTGFIGRHIVREAIERRYNTTVLSLNEANESQRITGGHYYTADIIQLDSLAEILIDKRFSHVINLGGYINHAKFKSGGQEVLDAHFLGVQKLIYCLDWDVLQSFVQIGSSDEYGDALSPQKEDIRERPISPYSMGKVAAGQLLQMLHRTEGFPSVMLRLFLVYGPGQNHQRFLPQIISGCLNGESFATSYGQQVRDFCYIDDIVRGIFLALENKEVHGEVINLASGTPFKIRSVIEEVVNIVGSGKPRYGDVPYRVGENMSLFANITKAVERLKWQPEIELNDGLVKTVDYYRSESELS